jgi:hypothetical protein
MDRIENKNYSKKLSEKFELNSSIKCHRKAIENNIHNLVIDIFFKISSANSGRKWSIES